MIARKKLYHFIISIICTAGLFTATQLHANITIMLDPAGNLTDPGRTIDGTSERTSMLQCAQALKTELEKNKRIKVIINRFPGEYVDDKTKAQLANQLHVDLYVRLQAYHERHPKVMVDIFTYTNFAPQIAYTPHQIVPYANAHMINYTLTHQYAQECAQELSKHERFVTINHVEDLPITALKGIRQPALCIEMGLKHATDWQFILEFLAHALQKVTSCL